MQKVDSASVPALRLSYVSALIAVVLLAVLAAVYERQSNAAFRQGARADVLDQLGLLRSDLQGEIEANIQLVKGLVAVIGSQPDMDQATFARLGARLLDGEGEVIIIAAAPDLRVSRLYPIEGNEVVLGLDYRTDPDQYDAVRLARDLGTTILTGPVDLRQGGQGLVARTPVFLDSVDRGRTFWGVVSAVIDPDALYRAGGLTDPELPIEVALVGRKGLTADGEVFFGRPDVLAQDPVTAPVELPFGAWEIAAVPKGGWAPPPAPWRVRALFALAGLLIVAPILGAARLLASRQAKLALLREREAELSRLSWRLEFALAASQVGVWDVDLGTDELLWDERAKALFGFPDRTGFFGEADWTGVIHPDDRARAVAQANAAVAGDGKFVSEYRIVRPDGEVRHIRDMAALYQAPDGSKRLVGLVWDVTADVERQAELNLRRLEAEAATVAKSRFLAAMSHEIRTPMSGVLGLLGLMLEGPLVAKQRERATIALASAQSLLGILNDILDFSKLEANQIRVTEETVAVRQVVGEVMDLMAAGAEQKGLALTHRVSPAVPDWIITDPMRLRQVLNNLVSNATKFTEAGRVEIRVDYAASSLRRRADRRGRGHRHRHLRGAARARLPALRAGRHLAHPAGRGDGARPRHLQAARGAHGRQHLGREHAGAGEHLPLLGAHPSGRGARRRGQGAGRRAARRGAQPADAHPARRGQRHQPVPDQRLPARRRAHGGDRRQRRGGGGGGAGRRLRRGADGRADAAHGRAERRPRHPRPARARRQGPDRGADRQRHVRRPRGLPRRRHDRLPLQAGRRLRPARRPLPRPRRRHAPRPRPPPAPLGLRQLGRVPIGGRNDAYREPSARRPESWTRLRSCGVTADKRCAAKTFRCEIADFDALYGVAPEAKARDGRWSSGHRPRWVSERFLLDVLTDKRCAERIPPRGLRISGARIDGGVDLTGVRLDRNLWIDHSRIAGPFTASGLAVNGILSLGGSTFDGKLDLYGVEAEQLVLEGGATFKKDVDLRFAPSVPQLSRL